MSLIRTGLLLAAVIMVLPAEDKKQAELTSAAARTAEQTATFCERNPSTCANGRDIWALFLRKAEYAMELGAKLLRDQLLRSAVGDSTPAQPPQPPQPPQQSQLQPASAGPVMAPLHLPRLEQRADTAQQQGQQRRNAYTMDNPSRWR